MQRIDLFTFGHKQQYGVQEAFSCGLQKALQRAHVASTLYPYQELGTGSLLAALVQNRPDYTAGFNVTVAEHSPLEPLAIPHLAMILDSASYFPELLNNPKALVSFVDNESVAFFQKLGCKNVFFLPHAIERECIQEAQVDKKDLDVVLTGSYIDPEAIVGTWRDLVSAESFNELTTLSEQVLASATLSPLRAFVELIEKHGAFEQELMQKGISFYDLLNSIDHYIRGMDRKRLVEAIDRPVHIFGAKQYERFWPKQCIFHDEVPYSQLHQIFSRARIVLNSMPMFKHALHERLLMSLAYNASVISTDSLYLRSQFPESKAISYYLSPNYTSVNDIIEEMLKDEPARLKAVQATHPILSHHTWDVRAKELLNYLEG